MKNQISTSHTNVLKGRTYVAQSIGSSLCESLCISRVTGSELRDPDWNCDAILLTGGSGVFVSDSELLAVGSLPPDKTSAQNRRSNKICRTPFSDTRESWASIVGVKSAYMSTTYITNPISLKNDCTDYWDHNILLSMYTSKHLFKQIK